MRISRIAEPFKHVEVAVENELGEIVDRYVISPGDDYSNEPPEIKLVCAELHTPEIVADYQDHKAEQ